MSLNWDLEPALTQYPVSFHSWKEQQVSSFKEFRYLMRAMVCGLMRIQPSGPYLKMKGCSGASFALGMLDKKSSSEVVFPLDSRKVSRSFEVFI